MEEKRQISHMEKCQKKPCVAILHSRRWHRTHTSRAWPHRWFPSEEHSVETGKQSNRTLEKRDNHKLNQVIEVGINSDKSCDENAEHSTLQNILQKTWSALPSLSKTRNFWEMVTDKGKLRNPEQSMSRRISDGSMSHGILAGSMSRGILDGTLQQNRDIR